MSCRLNGDFSMSIETERWKLRLIVPSTTSWPCDDTYIDICDYFMFTTICFESKTIIITVHTPTEQSWSWSKMSSLVSDSCLAETSRLAKHLNSLTAHGPEFKDASSSVNLPPPVLAKSNRNIAFSLKVKCRFSVSSSLQFNPKEIKTVNVGMNKPMCTEMTIGIITVGRSDRRRTTKP